MNEEKFIILAATIISITYLITESIADPAIAIVSYLPFLAGVIYCIKKDEKLWFIITGEILVINNHFILSSLAIQILLIIVIYSLYISEDILKLIHIIAAALIITALFAYLAIEIHIGEYAIICIAALLAIYFLLEIQWRRIKRKIPEDS